MKNHHEELRWQKDDEIEMKDERIRLKPCGDLDGGSNEMAYGIWTPKKKRWKDLELEFIHQEQTPKKKDYSLGWNKNKIYCMLILHQIKLITNHEFLHINYSSWKELRSDISHTWEGLHEPPVGLRRKKGLKW